MGDPILVEIAVDGPQVEADLVGQYVQLAPGAEYGVGVHHVGVEAEAGIGGASAVRRQAEPGDVPVDEVHQVAVTQHHALRRAGGAGGVQQYECIVRADFPVQRFGVGQAVQFVGEKEGATVFRHQFLQRPVGHHQRGAGILRHEVQPLRRIGGVQGLVGRAGLQYGDGHHRHPLAPGQQRGNPTAPADAHAGDLRGDGIGEPVQLGIGQCLALVHDGGAVGVLRDGLGQQLRHAFRRGRQLPVGEGIEGGAVGVADQRQHPQLFAAGQLLRHGGHRFGQPTHVVRQVPVPTVEKRPFSAAGAQAQLPLHARVGLKALVKGDQQLPVDVERLGQCVVLRTEVPKGRGTAGGHVGAVVPGGGVFVKEGVEGVERAVLPDPEQALALGGVLCQRVGEGGQQRVPVAISVSGHGEGSEDAALVVVGHVDGRAGVDFQPRELFLPPVDDLFHVQAPSRIIDWSRPVGRACTAPR